MANPLSYLIYYQQSENKIENVRFMTVVVAKNLWKDIAVDLDRSAFDGTQSCLGGTGVVNYV